MNERIQELAQQSQLAELYDRYVEQCMKNADDDILDYDVIVKEFAELFVQECAQVCEPTLDEPYEDMTEFGKGLVEGQDIAIERIKKHFGVEE